MNSLGALGNSGGVIMGRRSRCSLGVSIAALLVAAQSRSTGSASRPPPRWCCCTARRASRPRFRGSEGALGPALEAPNGAQKGCRLLEASPGAVVASSSDRYRYTSTDQLRSGPILLSPALADGRERF